MTSSRTTTAERVMRMHSDRLGRLHPITPCDDERIRLAVVRRERKARLLENHPYAR